MALIFFAVRVSIFKQTEITRAITKLMFAIWNNSTGINAGLQASES